MSYFNNQKRKDEECTNLGEINANKTFPHHKAS